MNAVCHRCGAHKAEASEVCPDCGHVPTADERPLAWLFSRAHLGEAELLEAGRRVRAGERAEPGRHLLTLARRALGQAPPDAADRLSPATQLALGLGCVLFTPLVGLAVWYGLRPTQPRAAWAAMRTTLPASLAFVGLWVLIFGTQGAS